jgi:hypothetical protein
MMMIWCVFMDLSFHTRPNKEFIPGRGAVGVERVDDLSQLVLVEKVTKASCGAVFPRPLGEFKPRVFLCDF